MSAPEWAALPGPWPDVLAAYVDGELSSADRAAVERRLAADPQARRELQAQSQLSPENWRLWQKVEPPVPPEEPWHAVQEAVVVAVAGGGAARVPPHAGWWDARRLGFSLAGGLAAAAAVLLAVGVASRSSREPPPPGSTEPEIAGTTPDPAAEDPLAGLEVLAIARNEDVVLERVEGNAGEGLPVGEPLLPGPIVLVSSDEIELLKVEDHPAWPSGGPKLSGGPGHAPMIFAAGPR
jgi:hypothetical protein